MTVVIRESIRSQALQLGWHRVGFASVLAQNDPTDQAQERLDRWIQEGWHGDLGWMTNPKRRDLRLVMPEVRSVVALALNYYTPHAHSEDPDRGKISRYGWGRDYHRIMQGRLKALSSWMMEQWPTSQARFYVDTGPVQDKVWAERSGLGWIGKHSNLITRDYGSWVFLGVILTTLDLPGDRPTPHPHQPTHHCGTCTRCLEACPTGAIVEPFVVDANRCIAYHTIENRSPELPETIVPHLHGWVAGCDICQDVCPWNQRFGKPTTISDFEPYPWNLNPPLEDLAHLDDAGWNQRFPASALRRIKPAQWRRNAQANQAIPQASDPPRSDP